MRKCGRCGLEKDDGEYNKKRGKLNSCCRACTQVYGREHYRRNKAAYKEKARQNKRDLRAAVLKYKEENPCVDCGAFHPAFVMDFDHLPQFDKERNVAFLSTSGCSKRVWEEIAKCELVCANCHRYRTLKRQKIGSNS